MRLCAALRIRTIYTRPLDYLIDTLLRSASSGGSSKGTGGSVRAFAGVVTLLTAVQAANVNTGWTGVVTVVYSNRADGVKSSLRWLKTRYQGEAKLFTVGGRRSVL